MDPRARIELRRMIRQLAVEGTAILVSSHILTELAEMCDQVGIIERGQLLAEGRVDEIQKQMQPHLRVTMKMLDRAEALARWLESDPQVMNIERHDSQVSFDFSGSVAQQAELLAKIIQEGFRPIEFGSQQQSLEDIFMQITTGAVQ